MTKIYIDANNRVRVDYTPNQEHARRAYLARGLISLYARLDRLAYQGIRAHESAGNFDRAVSIRSTRRAIAREVANLRAS